MSLNEPMIVCLQYLARPRLSLSGCKDQNLPDPELGMPLIENCWSRHSMTTQSCDHCLKNCFRRMKKCRPPHLLLVATLVPNQQSAEMVAQMTSGECS